MIKDTNFEYGHDKKYKNLAADEGFWLRSRQVQVLYDQFWIGQAGSIASGVFLVVIFWTVTPRSILITWFAIFMLLAALRLALTSRYHRSPSVPEQANHWLAWFIVGTVMSGTTWGSIIIVLIPDGSLVHTSFALLFTGALTAGTVAAYSVVKGAFLAFSFPALIPSALYLLGKGEKVEIVIGSGTLMFFGFLSLNALRMHKTLLQGLRLQLENAQLIAHLDQEKKRIEKLNAQLERRVAERTADLSKSNTYLQKEIAERKRAEEALRQAAAVFENTTEGAMITDTKGRIIAVNQAFTEITGYTQIDVEGKTPRLFDSDRHDESFYIAVSNSIAETGRWKGEIWKRRKNGEVFPLWLTINTVLNDRGRVTHYVSVFSDITHFKESQKQLEQLAHHDPLTGLPNRLLFHARVEHALERARREGGRVAVLFFDLDHFKNINDSLGHPAGDRLLQAVTERLRDSVREEDTVARLGGDEFTLLLEGLQEPKYAGLVAEKALQVLASPFDLYEHEAYITGSVGISLFPDDGQDVTTLLKNADSALYQAKAQGRNSYHFYTKNLTAAALERLALESSLRRGVARGEFILYYQPQVDLIDGQVIGAEALIRWRHPERGLVFPADFIPLCESTGLIVMLGEWVLRTACAQAKCWQNEGLPPLRMAVNVSSIQITRGQITQTVDRALKETGLEPCFIELEITEGLIMQQTQQTLAILAALKNMGVRLAIDDFGTGYSSLSYLKRLPLHRLKIDKSFVCDIPEDADDVAITRAIISLGDHLHLTVVAEGVETQAQMEFLRSNGCDEAQGYLYGAPLPAAEFADLVRHSYTMNNKV